MNNLQLLWFLVGAFQLSVVILPIATTYTTVIEQYDY